MVENREEASVNRVSNGKKIRTSGLRGWQKPDHIWSLRLTGSHQKFPDKGMAQSSRGF